ncbi:MAG: TolC family protein [Candidatus Poribacteria bacterium]|nr:TolC family protein [Candidatus Poribacteria bacterium]
MVKRDSLAGFVLLILISLLPVATMAQMEADHPPLPMQGIEAAPLAEAAEAALAESINLPTLIRLAVERNPKLKVVRANWQATIEKYPQVTALPDPMLMYSFYVRSVETRVGAQRHKLGFSQSFPYPGTLDAAGRVTQKQIAIEGVKYETAVRDLIVDLKLSFHELAYLQRAIQITQQNQDLLDHILKIANTRYAEGEATLNDVLKAQSQLAQLSYDLILLRELGEVEKANINALLSLPSSTSLGSPTPVAYAALDLPVADLEKQALTRRQELQMAELMIQKAAEAIELAKLKTKPMFKLDLMTIETGGALMPDTPGSGKNPFTIGLGVSIPWSSSKNRSQIAEAELKRSAAVENKRSMEDMTLANLKKIYFRLENARRLVALYEDSLIPQAEQAMEVAETWHQQGTKSITGFLETQSVWLNFNLARMRAIADYQQNLARLERLVGGSIVE